MIFPKLAETIGRTILLAGLPTRRDATTVPGQATAIDPGTRRSSSFSNLNVANATWESSVCAVSTDYSVVSKVEKHEEVLFPIINREQGDWIEARRIQLNPRKSVAQRRTYSETLVQSAIFHQCRGKLGGLTALRAGHFGRQLALAAKFPGVGLQIID